MPRFTYLLTAIILLASCSVNNRSIKTAHQQNIDSNALYYYSMAETALQIKDLNSAAQLLKKAGTYATDNIDIKERLLEVLSAQAQFDNTLYSEIITLGEECASYKTCSNRSLIILAESYSITGDIEQGDHYLKLALANDPAMNLYLSYYLFRKNQMADNDLSLLEKALESEWKDLKTVMLIAEVYNSIDIEKTLEILTSAYARWNEESVLRSILSIHEQRGENDQIISKIQQHLDAKNPASDFLKEHLISLYFRSRNFQAIMDNQDICLELDKDPALRYLFYSALSLRNTEQAIETAEIIVEKNDLPENVVPLFRAYFGYVLFAEKDFVKAAENFLMTSDINLVLDIISEFGMMQDISEDELNTFAEALLETSDQIDMAHFLAGYLYAILEEKSVSETYINRVSFEYLQERGLVESAAVILLNLDKNNLESVREMLQQRAVQIPSFNELTGFYYYNARQDSAAYLYFQEDIKLNPEPSIRLITAATMLAEQFHDLQFLLEAMDVGLELYSNEPEILNLFGYSIAELAIADRYPEARDLLVRSIEIDPGNLMYWDSLGWLYFRMAQYDKALAAMEKLLAAEIDNSEIAYHLGEIYLKLDHPEKGRIYLELAVELDNDIESVNLSRKILEELSNSEEN
jgi:tetratricopeptide (TPR) repeat protein